ncbi:SIMPL domain-containing protein [Neorhizobium sp. NCHU2750]|uniref:SIMPL domain-containing protein n=1 Tax=Neorhizobium sp. NCHU2750 TaxID=1825976 RepID=UPI000E74CCFD|nr:membrane protein [Neorhizobium sp. NCHU2750]
MNPVTRFATAALLMPVLLAVPLSAQAFAQDSQQQREAQITVSGEGEMAVAPNMAILSLTVLQQADTAEAALTANNAAMRNVVGALHERGVEERDIQTSQFQIFPRHEATDPKDPNAEPGKIIGYQVSNGLTVRVRDLSKLGALLDQSVKLGVNEGGQITFTNDNPDAALMEARKKAVAQALAKAKTLTDAAGIKLGRIIEMNENSVRPMAQPMMRMAMAKEPGDSVPISSGENTYSVTVNVTFALEQ